MPSKKNESTRSEKRQREKDNRKTRQKSQRIQENPEITKFQYKEKGGHLKPQTKKQSEYITQIEESNLIFAYGPAGCGKSHICLTMAADKLNDKSLDRLILVRPLVETGSDLGALPGEFDEKIYPYYLPVLEALYRRLGEGHVKDLIHNGRIVLQPLEFMRGQTHKHTWVILDEAENTTPKQMKMFLTRIGGDCKVIVNGDPKQSDIKGKNGLVDSINKLRHVNEIEFTEFTKDDVVRSSLTKKILDCYEKDYKSKWEIYMDKFYYYYNKMVGFLKEKTNKLMKLFK